MKSDLLLSLGERVGGMEPIAASVLSAIIPGIVTNRKAGAITMGIGLPVLLLLCLSRGCSRAQPPLAICFLGYTNTPSGQKSAAFCVSNQCSSTIMRWDLVCLEDASSPEPRSLIQRARATDSRRNAWALNQGGFHRAHETELILIPDPAALLSTGGLQRSKWRLRVVWSNGPRAKIALILRRR